MKKSLPLLLWLLAFLPLSAQETIDLSGSWDVAYGDSARYDGYAILPISIFSDEKASSETDSTRIWYRRSVYVPDSWRKHHVSLFLERPGTEITVYVNGTKAGSGTSFFAPQQFDISSSIRAGERNAIEVCVEHPSKCWDGISGRMELRAQSRNIYIRQVRLRPFPFDGIIQFDLTLDGSFSAFYNDYGQVLLQREGVDTARVISHYFELNNSHVLVNMFVGNQVALWDEFHPNLYRIGIAVANDYYETTFGMRQITYGDNHLLMNRYPLYLRGTEIDRHFLSTSSAVDESYWTGVFRRFKDCGLNFVRFRSCSPTEEAFTAADKVGIYLQPEGPSWPESGMTSGGERPSDELLLEESRRLIDTYGHHPSFLMMGSGCDSVKDGGGYCHKWVKEMMHYEPTIVYCGTDYYLMDEKQENPKDTTAADLSVVVRMNPEGDAMAGLKTKIEQNLCTGDNIGFLLQSLHDSIDAVGMRQFCSPVVPVARFPKTDYTTADTLVVPLECYNALYGNIQSIRASYYISNDSLEVFAGGQIYQGPITLGKNNPIGTVRLPLSGIAAPQKLTLTVVLSGNRYVNHWDFWVRPEELTETQP